MSTVHTVADCAEHHGLVRDFNSPRPTIVVLCGSTRFYDAFQEANYAETMAGRIVLSVGFYPHAKAKHGHGEGVGHDSAEKVALDDLHKRKIDLADEVYVLNVGGYVGESTHSEIEYAAAQSKPIRWLEGTDYRRDAAAADSAMPNIGGHVLHVDADLGSVVLRIVCREPEGAECRRTCARDDCDREDPYPHHDDDGTPHGIGDMGECNAVLWLTAGGVPVEEYHRGPREPLYDGMPVTVGWEGGDLVWHGVQQQLPDPVPAVAGVGGDG